MTAHMFAMSAGSKKEKPYQSVVLMKSKEYLKEHAEVYSYLEERTRTFMNGSRIVLNLKP